MLKLLHTLKQPLPKEFGFQEKEDSFKEKTQIGLPNLHMKFVVNFRKDFGIYIQKNYVKCTV